jgi:preprotein translocase SecE subunit
VRAPGNRARGNGSEHEDAIAARNARESRTHEAPDPLAHATPDAELAEARLALGSAGEDEIDTPEEEAELEELATAGNGRGGSGRAGAVVRPSPATPATPRAGTLARLIAFIQGSWAELQRVQWPDRRQVMQATGVVIGFVIVAGLFLAVADWAAGHIMTWILK